MIAKAPSLLLWATALLCTSCATVQPRAQRDLGLVLGTSGVIVGMVAGADPTGAVDDRSDRQLRTGMVIGAAAVAVTGIVLMHAAGDSQADEVCREIER
jgi:hypothetical protein